jgi:hypothetical protein
LTEPLDLEPHEYRLSDKRLRWWAHVALVALCVAILAFIWWNRDQFTAGTLFGVSALFAFCAGIGFTHLFPRQ